MSRDRSPASSSSRDIQIAVAGLSSIAVAYGFARYGYGLFVPVFRREFDLSTQQLGAIASASYASYLLALVATGVLAARMGPRALVTAGGLAAAAGMALIAAAPGTGVLIAGVVLASTSPGWTWAPFSDAVARMVRAERQSRALAVISTGTAFGLVIAGPVALLAGGTWRAAWIVFALAGVAVAAWSAWLLPSGPHPSAEGRHLKLRWRWFLCPESRPLFAVAFAYGLIAAVYFTFAVDLVAGRAEQGTVATLLWTVIGAAGVTGVLSGDLLERYGLRRTLAGSLAALGLAIGLLALAPGSVPVVMLSAALYGAAYMPIAALLAIWSSSVFAQQPATGFSATVFLLGLGSIVGPAALGALAGEAGLGAALLVTAAFTLLTAGVRPKHDVRSAAAPAASG